MNKAQKRPMLHKVLSMILALVMVLSLLPVSALAAATDTASNDTEFMRIFHLDCGRKYFSVSEIEEIIDQLAANHYTHIQLAFGNDGLRLLLNNMELTVGGKTYSDKEVKTALTNGNSTYSYNNSTVSTMLSQSDMDDIISYAKDKGIEVIPMFNAPYHINAVLYAMENLGLSGVRKTFDNNSNYLNLESDTAVNFVKALQQKYVTYFSDKGCKYYNFAADEYHFASLDNSLYTKFATFVNDLAGMIEQAGMTPMAYNDGFYYGSLNSNVAFKTNILICYWAEDNGRASAKTLADKGFKIINNSNAWYYVLGDGLYKAWGANGQWGYNDALNGINNTSVEKVKGDDGKVTPIGSVLCVWCDVPSMGYNSSGVNTSKTSKECVLDLITAMATANLDYFTDMVNLPADDTANEVSVVVRGHKDETAAVTATLIQKSAYEAQFNADKSVSYNITPAVEGKTYTGEGTVTLPVPEGWANDASRIRAYIITDGKVETIKGTLDNGSYTFKVPHFSEMGLLQVAENTPDKQETIKVSAGGTKTITINGANLSGDYTTNNPETATVTVTGKDEIPSSTSYNQTGVSYSALAGSNTSWTKTDYYYLSDDGNYYPVYAKYQYQRRNYYYYYYGYSATDSASEVTQIGSYSTSGTRTVTVYQKSGSEGSPAYTKITFTGVALGSTYVDIGNVRYNIEVVEKKQVKIPITIVDYRADGLLFDWTYNPEGEYADSYRYGFVHTKATGWGTAIGSGAASTKNSTTGIYEVNGYTASNVEKIQGTTIQKTGNTHASTTFYQSGTNNDWSRAGLVQEKLGDNGMPVYTDAAVQYVAGLLKAGYHNAVTESCNSIIYDTFVDADGSRSIRTTSTSEFSTAFANSKTYANIQNAYDLAWYLLNTLYQADTNMTTVTGTDGNTHSVPIYGMGVDTYKSIVLTPNKDGKTYSFEAGYSDTPKNISYDRTNGIIIEDSSADATTGFYPLENLGYEQPGLLTGTSVNQPDKNGSFTLRGESQFVYSENDNLYFTFTGDDDVYMYINGVLALDLGGAHGRNTKTVKLNDLDKAKYGLTDGSVATFTFFYMERCSDASTFGIETNMELVERDIDVQKLAYDTSYSNEIADGSVVNNSNKIAYDLVVTNKGNSAMNNISFADEDTFKGSSSFGYNVSASVNAGSGTDAGVVNLGESNSYTIFVTNADGSTEANSQQTFSSLGDMSTAVASVTLQAGQSLHVRFLTATTAVQPSKMLSYTNTVTVTANSGGSNLTDSASHTIYSYNANDTDKTYVVDFGLPVKIENIFDESSRSYIDAVKSVKKQPTYGKEITLNGTGFDTWFNYELKDKTTVDGLDTMKLSVDYKFSDNIVNLDKTINIIPASTVYYEDSFASFANGTGAAADAKWSNINDKDETVAENRTYPAQALEALGADGNNVYGYDSAYDETNSATYSMGSAHKVTVTSGMVEKWNNDSAWPTATFTFKGTGFDIISLTDNTSGAIMVSVYEGKDISAKSVKNYLVDNYYGYKYDSETKTWSTTNSTDRNALYQIPVIKVNSLPYGEYTVVIKAFYNGAFDHTTSKTEYSFWLDAIRVYDPMGESGNSYYAQDGEGWPQYIKLRDTIAAAGNDLGYSLFIDGAENADIATYANYGPNNEVYLASGQAISFKISANSNIASVQIGAKAPNTVGTNMSIAVNNGNAKVTEIKSATEMYYKIDAAGESIITVANTSNVDGSILSLTNLKITYSSESTVELVAMSNKEKTQAVMAVRALFAAPEPVVEPFAPERFEAKWNSVRKGQTATLTVKASTDVEAITVNGVTVDSYKTRTERTGILWWAQKVEYREFTYSTTANESADYTVCAVNAEGVASEPITATLTVKPAQNSGWWNNWWNGIFDKWF